jgi:hypothetical protein
MARDRFGFPERHEYSKEMPQGISGEGRARSVLRTAARYEFVPAMFGAGRRIAPAHEGPHNESNNKAHEPTIDRSTHYLIRIKLAAAKITVKTRREIISSRE